MNKEYGTTSDRKLISIVLHAPDSAEGKSAKEELAYRQYLTTKRHNVILLVLTGIIILTAVAQVIATVWIATSSPTP